MYETQMTAARWRYLSSWYKFLWMRKQLYLMEYRLVEFVAYPPIIIHPCT